MKDKSTTILLIEDNPEDLRYTEQLLSSPSYTFIEAKSSAEALESIKDQHVDVVLLNLSLPDSSELETVAHLASQRKELPIVVLTKLEDVTSAIKALHVGAHDCIVKDRVDAETLAHSINAAIAAKKREQIAEQLLQRTRLSALSAAVGLSLVKTTTLQEMLNGCIDAIVLHCDAAFVRIWTVDDREQVLILQASSDHCSPTKDESARIPIGRLREGLIASQKQTILRSLNNGHCDSDLEWAKSEGMTVFVGHPLLVGDRLLGVMTLFAKEPLGDIALSGLPAVADQVALGIERRIAEQSTALLASIVQCSKDGIISKNMEGVILSWNPAAERMFGYSADEMIGKCVSDLMPGRGVDELPGILEKLRNGESIEHYESTRLRKNGDVIDVSLTIFPILDGSGTISGASSIIRDITKRKRSDRLNAATNGVTRILAQHDSLALAAPYILQLIAKTIHVDFGALWCLDREQEILRCVDVYHEPDPRLNEFALLSKHVTFSTGKSFPGRILASGKPSWIPDLSTDGAFARLHAATNGSLCAAIGFPILLGTKVLGVLEFFGSRIEAPDKELLEMMTNIGSQIGQLIDRKHAKQAAAQSAQSQLHFGQSIMGNAPIGIAWLDKNLVISEANSAFSNQFGVAQEDLAGTYIFQTNTGIPNEWFLNVIEHGQPFSSTNWQIAPNSGPKGSKDAFCDLTIWPVKDEDAHTVGLVILTVTVTERVKLAKQREDFVATLTHDLKNPLIGQSRVLALILNGQLGPLHGEQAGILSLLKTGTDELLELIGTLLEVYRYEDGVPQLRLEQLDVKQLIDGCVAQLKPIADVRNIEITSAFPTTLEPFDGDRMALRRVVMNLMDNAIKFTPPDGMIKVSCRSSEVDLIITIEDSGSGICAEELQLLFQRYSQTGSGRVQDIGTGLGLYLCRQIVEAHGGKITCESKEGSGTSLVVTLPVPRTLIIR